MRVLVIGFLGLVCVVSIADATQAPVLARIDSSPEFVCNVTHDVESSDLVKHITPAEYPPALVGQRIGDIAKGDISPIGILSTLAAGAAGNLHQSL